MSNIGRSAPTIARELNVHPDTVRNAIETERFRNVQPPRPSLVDPYLEFIRQVLEQYPRLRATRIQQMIRDRGYSGNIAQLRRAVARLRPSSREPFLRLQLFPGEQAQVDWAHFGHVLVGRARRALSCFAVTLSCSRALYLEFFFDQTMENFLRGHVHAFQAWNGQPRVILYDNLKSAVLVHFGRAHSPTPFLISRRYDGPNRTAFQVAHRHAVGSFTKSRFPVQLVIVPFVDPSSKVIRRQQWRASHPPISRVAKHWRIRERSSLKRATGANLGETSERSWLNFND